MNYRIISFISLLIFILAIASVSFAESGPVRVEGIILSTEGPLAGGTVYAYPDYPSLMSDTNVFKSEPLEKTGQFRLEIPAGTYYLVARGTLHGKPMYSFHGLNPVGLKEEYRWLPFFVVEAGETTYHEGPQGIGGTVYYKEQPLSEGMVSVYSLTDSSFRGMGLLTNSVDEDGHFWFELEQGEYVVIARKRQGNSSMGPLRKGDLFCYPGTNPVSVLQGRASEISVFCYPRDDLEAFLDQNEKDPRGKRRETRRTASMWDTEIEDASRIRQEMMLRQPVLVSGTVKDLSGNPVEGLYVSAYPADQFPLFQMFVIRLITDYMTRTDSLGRYYLELEAGRQYYLVAREKTGEAPNHLELYGLYEGNANHSITVRPDHDTSQVDIVVDRIMP